MKRLKLFLILLLVLAIPSYQVHAASNTSLVTYTITYKYTNIIYDDKDTRLRPRPAPQEGYWFYPDATIKMSDYIPNLDRLSGYSERALNSLYITNCYIQQIETIFSNGTSVDRSKDTLYKAFLFNFSDVTPSNYEYFFGDNLQVNFPDNVDLSSVTLHWYLSGLNFASDSGFGSSAYIYNLPITEKYNFVLQVKGRYYVNLGDVITAIENVNNDVVVAVDEVTSAIEKQTKQELDWRNEDKKNATDTQDTITNFANSTESTVKSKWAILFYPIEFTTRILGAFNGGTSSASYDENYRFVDGYTYNEETGGLEPIYNYNKPVLLDNDSVPITFPSFTLPVLNLKLWDSYTFDLATLKDNFPMAFNALYTVEGIIEIYAFVGFLQSKYDEVFGG